MIKRKVFSAVIIICLTLQCFFVQGVAAQKGSVVRAQDAFGLLKYLEIMPADADYAAQKDNAVTRGEFAVYLARTMKIARTAESAFTDVSPSDDCFEAVGALTSAKILNGYSDGTFAPQNSVTKGEMMFAALRVLGYRTEDWTEADYYVQAGKIDLLSGISGSGAATLSDCTVLLYNMLHADTVEFDVWNNSYKKVVGDTALKTFFDIDVISGQITGNAYLAIDGEKTGDASLVTVDGVLYRTNVPEIGEWIGHSAAVYCKNESNVNRIVYFIVNDDDDTLVIDADDLVGANNHTIEYVNAANKTKKLALPSNAVIIRNSQLAETDVESAFDIDYGKITCVMQDGKYRIIIIDAFENFTVKQVDISREVLYLSKAGEDDVTALSIDADSRDYVSFKMLPYGKEVNAGTIQPGDLLSVCKSADGMVVKGFLCSEKVSGRIDTLQASGSTVTVWINGGEYRLDPRLYADQNLSVGTEGTFTLDFSGRIAAYSPVSVSTRSIGYVYAIDEGGLEKSIRLKIFNTAKKHLTLELNDKIRLNGESRSKEYVYDALCSASGMKLRRQLIEYDISEAGKINSINLAAADKDSRLRDNSLYTLLPAGSYYWYYQMKSFERKYVLNSKTYYMRVPADDSDDETLFGCQPFSNVTWYNTSGDRSIMGLYKFDDSTPYADLILVKSSDSAALTNQSEITAVADISRVASQSGGDVTAVRGFRRGVEVTAYFEDSIYKNDIEVGDLIRFATDVRGNVGDYEIIYDQSEDRVTWTMGATANEYSSNTASVGASPRYTFGYVNRLYIAPYTAGLNSVIEIGAEPGVTDDIYQIDSSSTATTRFIVYDKNRRENKVYMAHLDEITSYENCHDISSTSKVFVHSRYGWVVAVIIYK